MSTYNSQQSINDTENDETVSAEQIKNETDDLQQKHLDDVGTYLSEIIPPELRHKYCILMGSHVLGSYDTAEDAHNAKVTKFGGFLTIMYVPPLKEEN